MASSPRSISARAAWCAEAVSGTAVEALFRREDIVVLAALVMLILLAWLALLAGAGTGMDPFVMSGWLLSVTQPAAPAPAWTSSYWLIAFLMWAVMMVAMMLPSASPMVLLHARVARQAEAQGQAPGAPAAIAAFASGYLTIWILFSLLAVIVQWGLERLGALSAMMSVGPGLLAGALLIAAGLYQFTPLKAACLTHCRTPASFLAALAQGRARRLAHGTYPRALLPRLLRRADGAVVRRRRDESDVDRRAHPAGGDREARAVRRAAAKAVAALLIAGGVALMSAAW